MRIKVFISYAREDISIAKKFKAFFDKENIDYFLDMKERKYGSTITKKILKNISECTDFLVIVSDWSRNSPWVSFEIGAAMRDNVYIIPYKTNPNIEDPEILKGCEFAEDFKEIEDLFLDRIYSKIQRKPISPPPNLNKFIFGGIEIDELVLDGNGERSNTYLKENIITHYDPTPIEFPDDIIDLKRQIEKEEERKRENALSYCWNGPMYLLEKFVLSRTKGKEFPVLDLWFRDSDYYNFLVTNKDPANKMVFDKNGNEISIFHKYMPDQNWLHPTPFLTTSFGVNVALITRDDYLILVKRSKQVYGYRDIYDVSVVEGLKPGDDIDEKGNPDLYKCAIRGALEEIGIKLAPEQVIFLSFGVKCRDIQYGIMGMAKLDESFNDVETLMKMKFGKDSLFEIGEILPLDITKPDQILKFIYRNHPTNWSPNGLVCIVHTLNHEFGQEEIKRMIFEI